MKQIICILILATGFFSCGDKSPEDDETEIIERKLTALYSGRVSRNGNYTGREFQLSLYNDSTYSESISITGNHGSYGDEYLILASGKYSVKREIISLSEKADISVYVRKSENGGTSETRTTSELSKWFPAEFYIDGKQITSSGIHPTGFNINAFED